MNPHENELPRSGLGKMEPTLEFRANFLNDRGATHDH